MTRSSSADTKKEQRNNSRRSNSITCPGCSQATSSKGATISRRPEEHRGTMTGTNPNQTLWRNVHLAQAPPGAVWQDIPPHPASRKKNFSRQGEEGKKPPNPRGPRLKIELTNQDVPGTLR